MSARRFQPALDAPGAARRFVTETLADLPPEQLQAIALMVSELAANSVRHAKAPFDITIRRSETTVRVEVTDDGPGAPVMRSPRSNESSGRGLHIVDTLADAWGVTEEGAGKTVWLTLSLGAPRRSTAPDSDGRNALPRPAHRLRSPEDGHGPGRSSEGPSAVSPDRVSATHRRAA